MKYGIRGPSRIPRRTKTPMVVGGGPGLGVGGLGGGEGDTVASTYDWLNIAPIRT